MRYIMGLISGVMLLFAVSGIGYAQNFDHSDFDELLKKHVNNRGQVNYVGFKQTDRSVFDGYLQKLATAGLASMGLKEKLAFWINAYNAFVIQAVIKRYPLKSVMDYPEFFKEKAYTIAGKQYSLDDIENAVIRPGFSEARIHFALVCAAKSCPILQNSAYTTSTLEDKLDRGAKAYLNDKSQNYIDANTNTLYLSQLFSWFSGDFEKQSGSVVGFVGQYLEHSGKGGLAGYSVKYLNYDWQLNSQ